MPHGNHTLSSHFAHICWASFVVKQQKCRSSAIPPCGLPPHRLGRDAPSPPQLSTCLPDTYREGSALGERYPTCVVDETEKLVTVFCSPEEETVCVRLRTGARWAPCSSLEFCIAKLWAHGNPNSLSSLEFSALPRTSRRQQSWVLRDSARGLGTLKNSQEPSLLGSPPP